MQGTQMSQMNDDVADAGDAKETMKGSTAVKPSYLHGELTYSIVGCAQRVHSALGPGFPEIVYHRSLCHELAKAGIPSAAEAGFEVAYDGIIAGRFKVDVCVDHAVIVEIKACEGLCDAHKAQALAYLKASGLRVAPLINFGEPRLKVKRFVM